MTDEFYAYCHIVDIKAERAHRAELTEWLQDHGIEEHLHYTCDVNIADLYDQAAYHFYFDNPKHATLFKLAWG